MRLTALSLVLVLAPLVAEAQPRRIPVRYADGATGTLTLDATPGGDPQTIQFNNDAGSFGGVPILKWNGTYLASTGSGVWLRSFGNGYAANGPFGVYMGSASNLPGDARRDDNYAIGWNLDNAVVGAGSAQLTFETHCVVATGCGSEGQSETYFNFDDGQGRAGGSVRALGFFQRQGGSAPFMNVISRADVWGFYDAPQDHPLFIVRSAAGGGYHSIFGKLDQGLTGNVDWLTQEGVSLIRKSSGVGGVAVCPQTGCELGATGEYRVHVQANHFSFQSDQIEDPSGATRLRIGNGSLTGYLRVQNDGGANSVLLKPDGTKTKLDFEINPKGDGDIILNSAGHGAVRIKMNLMAGYHTGGVSGTTTNSCGTTTPAISGSNVIFQVTVGATSGSSCTVNFGDTWLSAPYCIVVNNDQLTVVKSAPSTSSVVLTGAFNAGDHLTGICIAPNF